jgi:hypothetical protein
MEADEGVTEVALEEEACSIHIGFQDRKLGIS